MADIKSNVSLNDGMSPIMKHIYQTMKPVLQAMGNMQELMGESVEPSAFTEAQEQVQDLADKIENVPDLDIPVNSDGIEETKQQTEQFNDQLKDSQKQATYLDKILKGLTIAGLIKMGSQLFKNNVAIADNYNTVKSQINMMNDGLQDADELQNMIFQSAKKTRSSYEETAALITKMNATSGEMFSNNASLIQFLETFQQATIASGATIQQQEQAMNALDKAMANGVLRGQEFNTIMQTSPRTIQAIADHLGVTIMEVRNLASEGKITADVLANSMFESIDAINAEFNKMPDTWEDHMTNMGNMSLRAFEPLMEAFSNFINSDAWYIFMDLWIAGIQIIAGLLTWMFDIFVTGFEIVVTVMGYVAEFIASNIDYIIGALIALIIYLTIVNWQFIKTGIVAVASAIKAAAAWLIALWPIGLLIGAVLIFIWIMEQMGITVADICGFVAGIFGALFAFTFNLFVYFYTIVASVAEFFVNVWKHPAYSTQKLFHNLISNVVNLFASFLDTIDVVSMSLGNAFITGANIAIKGINWIISALNNIPGINIGEVGEIGTVSASGAMGNSVRGWADGLDPGPPPDDYWEAPKMSMMNGIETATNWNNATSNFVSGISDKISGSLGGIMSDDFGMDEMNLGDTYDLGLDQNYLDALGNLNDTTGKGLGSANDKLGSGGGLKGVNDKLGSGLGKGNEIGDIGRVKDDVSISDEDWKLLKDIAEREFVINHQQFTPQINVEVNNANGDTDVEALVDQIEDMIIEKQASLLMT